MQETKFKSLKLFLSFISVGVQTRLRTVVQNSRGVHGKCTPHLSETRSICEYALQNSGHWKKLKNA